MSYITWDYECPSCGCVEERVTCRDEVNSQNCQACGGPMTKLLAAPHFDYRMGVDTAYGTFGDKWARMQRQKAAIAAKKRLEHGD